MRNIFTGFFSLFLSLCLLFLLSACSSLVTPTLTNSSQVPVPREYHQHIELSGRLSAQYEENFKPKAIHVNFQWSQTPEKTTITFDTPTGQTLATLLITEQGAQLNQANQSPQFASNVNRLLANTLGWPLPVAGLRNWLQGFIDITHKTPITPAMSNQTFDADGWELRYPAWIIETEKTYERPKRLDLTRQTEQAGLVTLRIVIDEWNQQ